MDNYERAMIAAVNRNRECKEFAERLNAISARRRKKKRLFARGNYTGDCHGSVRTASQ